LLARGIGVPPWRPRRGLCRAGISGVASEV